MKKSIMAVLAAFLLLAAQPAPAEDLSITYLEGAVRVRSGSGWNLLSTGDTVPMEATVRLEAGGCVQLKGTGIDFLLTRPGTYDIKDVVARHRGAAPRGILSAVASALRALATGGRGAPQNTASGARAADVATTDEEMWMESSAEGFLEAGKGYLKAGRYDEAMKQLRQAELSAGPEEAAEVRFYLGTAYAAQGDLGRAWKSIDGLAPARGADWAGDLVLLKARLLLDTSAFADAAALLSKDGAGLAEDPARAPLYHFLLGVAWRGAGDAERSRQELSRAAAIAPGTELAAAAADLLKSP